MFRITLPPVTDNTCCCLIYSIHLGKLLLPPATTSFYAVQIIYYNILYDHTHHIHNENTEHVNIFNVFFSIR